MSTKHDLFCLLKKTRENTILVGVSQMSQFEAFEFSKRWVHLCISGLVKKHSQEWMCTKPRCNAIIVWLTFRMNGKMNNRNEWEFYFFCTWKKDRVDDIKLQLMISIYYSGKGFSFSRISWTFIFATEVWMGLHKGNHCSARMFVCVTRDTNLGKSKPMQRLSGR